MVARRVLLLVLALAAPASLAQSAAPEALPRSVADELIDKIKLDQELQGGDRARADDLVQSSIVPLFDFDRMTRLAVAHNWNMATPEQQGVITDEFRTLLVRTYATALAHFRGEPVVFKQLRPAPAGTNVTVRSEVKQPGKERMTLDYEMDKTAAGWRIYNVKLADVCLISNYRDVFAEKVRAGGVEGLIKFLVDKNREGGSRFNAIEPLVWEQSRVLYAILQNAIRSGLH
ncbi:MAG: ABC transporter substrate-binding protein [Burkholderiales bacterium]|nr:ABC transporter substrate-binding protein [Burkholderiales bacterium]